MMLMLLHQLQLWCLQRRNPGRRQRVHRAHAAEHQSGLLWSQVDLVKDNGAKYFVDHLAGSEAPQWAPSRAQVCTQCYPSTLLLPGCLSSAAVTVAGYKAAAAIVAAIDAAMC